MTRKALVLLGDGFEDIEAVAPIDILNRAGIEVVTAGLAKGPVRGAYGCTIVPETSLANVTGLFDALVLPGGKVNAENLASNERVLSIVREHMAAHRIVAAICASPALVLGQAAGILKGRRATGTPELLDLLSSCGATPSGESLTVDGNIITAMGPGAALHFGLKLAELLSGKAAAETLAARWQIKL